MTNSKSLDTYVVERIIYSMISWQACNVSYCDYNTTMLKKRSVKKPFFCNKCTLNCLSPNVRKLYFLFSFNTTFINLILCFSNVQTLQNVFWLMSTKTSGFEHRMNRLRWQQTQAVVEGNSLNIGFINIVNKTEMYCRP